MALGTCVGAKWNTVQKLLDLIENYIDLWLTTVNEAQRKRKS